MFIEVDNKIITKNVDSEENTGHQMSYKLFELMNDGKKQQNIGCCHSTV